MTDVPAVVAIVEDLIRVAHQQAKELEQFADRVEQATGRHLGYTPGFGVIAAELTELLIRARKLSAEPREPAAP